MGITHLQEFSKPAMIGLVEAHEQELYDAPTIADRFMPDENIFSTNFAYDIIKKSNHIAAMIGYGAEPPVIDRDAVASRSGELVKMGLKYIATEEELLALNQARSNEEKSAMVDRLTVQAVDLLNALRRKVTITKLEALIKGEVSYNKNGVKVNFDFGVPADHKKVQTGTSAWNDPAATPLSDLIAWNDEYMDANGQMADAIIMSRDVLRLLQTNAEVVAESTDGSTTRISVESVQDVLASYGLPPVEVMNRRKIVHKDVYSGQEEEIEYLPQYRLVFVAEGVGRFLFGPTAENEFQPGVDLRAYDKFEPIQSVIRVAAAGFPVVENPHLLLFADVASA